MTRMSLADALAHNSKVRGIRPGSLAQLGRTRSKFGARRCQVDGIWFDSKAEGAHYRRLLLLEAAGLISDLRVHSRWPLVIGGIEVGAYESDFDHLQDGTRVIVDVKGKPTDLYLFKRKIFEALYPVKITEVRKAKT